jgi:hypothetical protein
MKTKFISSIFVRFSLFQGSQNQLVIFFFYPKRIVNSTKVMACDVSCTYYNMFIEVENSGLRDLYT